MILDSSLSFDEHLISDQSKTNKAIVLLRKLQNTLPRQVLTTVYQAFVRSHVDCGDILHDQVIPSKTRKNTRQCFYSNSRSYSSYLERENISRIRLRIL